MDELRDFLIWYKITLGSENKITAEIFNNLVKKFTPEKLNSKK